MVKGPSNNDNSEHTSDIVIPPLAKAVLRSTRRWYPQGTAIGPDRFLMNMNDLRIQTPNLKLHRRPEHNSEACSPVEY